MRLTRLRLRGFKSFADPTVIDFDAGVSAIVGPNGSGKSNVVDAIAWVLGAQSPRLLRLTRMEELIFAGGVDRAQLGRAEVTLELASDDGATILGLSEVAISRIVLRSGEAEYRLNGQQCRLADLVELLGAANVGRSQHVLISQGEIDSLVNAKGEEIRAVLEDAAQVAPLRRRRDQALRNLAAVEERLREVSVYERELKRRIRPLREQAELYAQKEELSQRREAVARWLARQRLRALGEDAVGAEVALADLVGEIDRGRRELETIVIPERDRDLRDLYDRVIALTARLFSIRATLQRASSLVADRRRIELGRDAQYRQRIDEQARIDRSRKELLSRVVGLESEGESLVRQREVLLLRLQDLVQQYPHELPAMRVELQDLEIRLSGTLRVIDEHRRSAQAAKGSQEAFQRRLQECDHRLATLTEALVAEGERLRDAESLLLDTTAAQELSDARCAEVRALHSGIQSALRSSREIRVGLVGERESLLRLMPRDDAMTHAPPTLLEVVSPKPGWEIAVAAVLGDRGEAVVYPSLEAMLDVAERTTGGFSGVVELVDTQDFGDISLANPSAPSWARAMLGRVVVVDSVVEALRGGVVHDVMVDASGSVWRGGHLLVGESFGSAIRLQLRGIDERLMVAKENEHGFVVESERLTELLNAREKDLRDARRRLEELRTRIDSSTRSIEVLEREVVGVQHEREAINSMPPPETNEAEEQDFATELSRLETEREQLRAQVETLSLRSQEVDRERIRLERGEVESRLNAAALGARVAEMRERLGELDAREYQLVAELATLDPSDEEERKQLRVLEYEVEDLELRGERIAEVLAACESELVLAEESSRVEVARADARIVELVNQLEQLEERRLSLVARSSETRTRLAAEEESFTRSLATTLIDIERAVLPEGVAPTVAESYLVDLDSAIARVGSVNPLALGELDELEADLTRVRDGASDVRATNKELAGALAEVESEMASRMRGVVGAVSEAFAALMARLFPGGSGLIEFEDSSDMLASPLQLVVSVPAKRVNRLALLSGGERSLVGLAFLFAVLAARPSPFVVLDEVEAALDEKNLAAFADLLAEIGINTQILVVTHQRRTMEAADMLIGVSISPSGVSRVVRHRLE
ncbi:MAG: chromosome segregation protein SMC [Ferrimicrobium sp.]